MPLNSAEFRRILVDIPSEFHNNPRIRMIYRFLLQISRNFAGKLQISAAILWTFAPKLQQNVIQSAILGDYQ